MDRVPSSTFYGNMGTAMGVLRDHGYPTDALKPPSLFNYLRSAQPPQTGQENGVVQKPSVTEGVKVELSRDSVEISVGPELAKSLKSADLGKLFESLYNTPQVKSALARINQAA
ncbi:hypothetical protein ACFQH5_20490 [Halomonas salifodinae]|uniref:Uncharacterized protein n=1 Tax=Halomonas salifodinae TaxID=438745 RepID=A0ABW2F135_9GAMM